MPRANLTIQKKQTKTTPPPTPPTKGKATVKRDLDAAPVAKGDTFPEIDKIKVLGTGVKDTWTLRERVKELIEDEINYAEQEKAVKDARKSIKEELGEICKKLGIASGAGVRDGRRVVYFNGYRTTFTLSKEMLVANGVKVKVIDASYTESEPWVDLKVSDLDAVEAERARKAEAKANAKAKAKVKS